MADREKEIEKLENQFPPVSGEAFAVARANVLASGQSVLQAENGCIYRVFPSGRKEFVKRISPPLHYEPGTKISIP